MKKTKIEWCDSTFNPISGCFHQCDYCYARRVAERFGSKMGTGELHILDEPVIIDDKRAAYPYDFDPTFFRYRLQELRHEGKRIFVGSMSDIFGQWIPDEWISEIFGACKANPNNNYMFLTKNPGRYIELYQKGKLPEGDNFWYGTTVTRPDDLYFFSEGHNTFLSIEPILSDFPVREIKYINWIIIGAETGNRKDKVLPQRAWIDHIVESAKINQIPVFMKDSLEKIMNKETLLDFPKNLKNNGT